MSRQIVLINGTSKNPISLATLYLLILMIIFTIPVTLSIPGMGSHIVIYLAEFFVIFGWGIDFVLHKFKVTSYSPQNESYLIKIRNWTLIFWAYVIISRVLMLSNGFNAGWFSYPRVSFIFLVSFFWLIRKNYSSKDKIDAVLLFVSYLDILELIYFIQSGTLRSSKILLNVNIYVCIVVVVLPTLTHLILNRSTRIRKIWYVSLLICSLALILLSGSRAGTSIAVFAIGYEIIRERDIRGKFLFIIVAIAFGVVFFANIERNELQEVIYRSFSFLTGAHKGADSNALISDGVRSEIWYLGIQIFKAQPLLGAGILTFDFNMGIYKVHQSAHNFLIELLMSYGIIGTIIYGIIINYILKINNGNKNSKRVVYLTMASYLAFSFVEPTFVEKIILFIFLMLVTSESNELIKGFEK